MISIWPMSPTSTKFGANRISGFCVIPPTNNQTNQTDSGDHMASSVGGNNIINKQDSDVKTAACLHLGVKSGSRA